MQRQRQAVLIWPRWTGYREGRDGWIHAYGAADDPYEVDWSDDLPTHLAAVADGHVKNFADRVPALMKFYRTFGLLGGTTVGKPRSWVVGGQRQVWPGDDVAWAIRHARNVWTILSLDRARGAALDRLLRDPATRHLRPRPQVPTCDGRLTIVSDFDLDATLKQEGGSGPGQRRIAQQITAELLNPSLASVPRVFDPDSGEPRFHFTALIQCVYWQLADRLGHYRVKRCPCGRLFFQIDPRQEYCPPPPGRHESTCAGRFRRRRNRRAEARSE